MVSSMPFLLGQAQSARIFPKFFQFARRFPAKIAKKCPIFLFLGYFFNRKYAMLKFYSVDL